MRRGLDLADIQGNIVRPYGRFGFPVTRHLFFNIANATAGRHFIDQVRQIVTTAERWGKIDDDQDPNVPTRPLVAVNIGLSFRGMLALELPTRTLGGMPEEFIDGMALRWSILGDFGPSGVDHWDPIWRNAADSTQPLHHVHLWVSLSAQANPDATPVTALLARTNWLKELASSSGGVTLLTGHRGAASEFQDSTAIFEKQPDGSRVPTAKEHFGFTDGISDPTFKGQYEPSLEALEVIGGGKLRSDGKGWAALAVGEFILGHASEAQELPPAAAPWTLTRNGTFMAYRKLHQNVASFRAYADAQAVLLQKSLGAASTEEARETILAKMVGRWRSGIPIAVAPTYQEAQKLSESWSDIPAIQLKGTDRTPAETQRLAAYEQLITDFRYKDDPDGAKCPLAAHIRRTNPRDALDPYFGTPGATPDSSLSNRRRILRRGLPYGNSAIPDDSSEHGVIFMAMCANLFRQFEFIQQQWVQYGSSFGVGNDTDPVVGLRRGGDKFVIPTNLNGGGVPAICANIPQFVESRGGEYFFIPSLTALREIAEGSVDPT